MKKAEQIQKFKEGCLFLIECFKEINNKKEKYIWGLDISLSNTGLVVFKNNKYDIFSHKQKGTRYQRLHLIERAFEHHVEFLLPKLVIIEGYAFGSRQNREILGEAGYAVKRCFTYRPHVPALRIPCLTVAPLSLKKFVIGKAKGISKNQLHKYIQSEWQTGTKNNDESDAYALNIIGQNIYQMIINIMRWMKTTNWSDETIHPNSWKDLFEEGNSSELERHQWEVIRNIIMNDGTECKRFYP
jgi:Holliday junction resolvasome RuvABC endonuclease subunit